MLVRKDEPFLWSESRYTATMKFCPNCGMTLTHIKTDHDATLRFRCPRCMYVDGDLHPHKPIATVSNTTEEKVVVIEEDQDLQMLPTERAECPKCQNNVAYVWQVQTRSADEGATQFYRCTKCSHTWRLYT